MKTTLRFLLPAVLFASLGCVGAARAETIDPIDPPPAVTFATLLSGEDWSGWMVAPPGLPDRAELATLDRRGWRELRDRQIAALKSDDERTRQQAMQTIIYLNVFYPGRAHFERAAGPLLHTYSDDARERNRIMALVALRSIGQWNTMVYLGQCAATEPNARVRRMTLAAVHDFYQEKAL